MPEIVTRWRNVNDALSARCAAQCVAGGVGGSVDTCVQRPGRCCYTLHLSAAHFRPLWRNVTPHTQPPCVSCVQGTRLAVSQPRIVPALRADNTPLLCTETLLALYARYPPMPTVTVVPHTMHVQLAQP